MIKAAAVALVALVAMASSACAAKPDPRDAFTSEMAARFQRAYPGLSVTISEPLTLVLKRNGDEMTTNLDRIYNFCQTNAKKPCAETKANFVAASNQTIAGMNDPALVAPRRENLRLVVREAGYCQQVAALMAAGKVPSAPVTAPFTADTCLIMMFDFPTTRRTAMLDDIATLGLTRDAAWELAKAQVLQPLPKLALNDVQENALNAVTSFPDNTSLVLDTPGWTALAAKHKGKQIIVTIPDEEMLTLMIVEPDTDLADLKKLTRESFESAQRGISPQLLRWAGDGWQILP